MIMIIVLCIICVASLRCYSVLYSYSIATRHTTTHYTLHIETLDYCYTHTD